jgi:hypothetical protein
VSSPWIQTFTGKKIYPLNPEHPDNEWDIADIAHSLAMQCRWNGHSRTFYSVAQHSVYVAEVLPPPLKLVGLLHDAAEAYISDIARPIKRNMFLHVAARDKLDPAEGRMRPMRDVENDLLACILESFGCPRELPPRVHAIDNRMLVTEAKQLLFRPPVAKWFPEGQVPQELLFKIKPMSPEESESRFYTTFNSLRDCAVNG